MNLYLENGYFNLEAVQSLHMPFNFIVGGRGTGKTYGALKYVIETNQTFFLLRRRKEEVDALKTPATSPFKKLNDDMGWNIVPASVAPNVTGFYKADEDGHPTGAPIGYLGGLTSMANIRGFDASDVTVIIYDEFIPEKHKQTMRHEYEAFTNAYETINRNREIQGQAPVQCFMLANSENVNNALFEGFDLVNKAEQMQRKGQAVSVMKDRGIGIFFLENSPISRAKAQTALYKATAGSEYAKMALDNHFTELDDPSIRHCDIKNYNPKYLVNGVCIYEHKSEKRYYVTEHVSGSPIEYGTTEKELIRFTRNHVGLYTASINGKVYFENYGCLMKFNEIYK